MAIETPESTPKRTRRSHYQKFVISLHESSKVDLGDLLQILQSRADDAGESLTLKTSPRQTGVIYVLAPKRSVRSTPQERAKKKMQQFVEAARKAGLDPKELLG